MAQTGNKGVLRRSLTVGLLVVAAGAPTLLGQPAGDPPTPADQPPIKPAGDAKPPAPKDPPAESKEKPKAEPAKAEPPKSDPAADPAKPQPPEDPTKSPAVDEVAKQQEAKHADPGPIAPKQNKPPVRAYAPPARPGTPAPKIGVDDVGVPTGGRFAEGKFLLRRTGTLIKAPTGEWIFAFAKTTAAKPERPAILMPCTKLSQLEAQIGAGGVADHKDTATPYPDTLVTITGEVFNYGPREYILLTLFSVAPNTGQPEVSEPMPPTSPKKGGKEATETKASGPEQPADTGASGAADPAVDELIRDLQTRRGNVEKRALTAAPTPPKPAPAPRSDTPAKPATKGGETTVAAAPPGQGLRAEGTVLTSKRGRLIRLRGGELAFGIDNDVASATQPLVLLPCRTLDRLEQLFWGRGDATVIELSGRTTIYQGRNYLLPTSFIVPVPSELRPMQ